MSIRKNIVAAVMIISAACVPASFADPNQPVGGGCVTEGEGNMGQIVFEYMECLAEAGFGGDTTGCDVALVAALNALNASISQYDNCDHP